jgi:hypothetical protein
MSAEPLEAGDPRTQVLSPKESNLLQRPGDIYEVICTGAAGLGDPLTRDPREILNDLEQARFSRETAAALFGVVLGESDVDLAATEHRRKQLRQERLAAASPSPEYRGAPVARLIGNVTDTLEVAETTDGDLVVCSAYSHEPLCSIAKNYKQFCPRIDLPVQDASPLAADPSEFIDVKMELRLYLCPRTGALLETEIARAEDPPLHEIQLDPETLARLRS